ncbi:MAG: isovaleryl-CoA dehydrogenase [Acidimicrobiia bacterium]|nr:isovaleryl-CoA dehydrogenase [Acidimicrobiia bacterium]
MDVLDDLQTHEVVNQSVPFVGRDWYATDVALVAATEREGGGWARDELIELGRFAGSDTAIEWGRLANEHPPVLKTHDRFGKRIDTAEYHPAYHQLMDQAIASGVHAGPWSQSEPGAHVVRAAKFVVWYQVDAGHCCPISMTYSAVPALRHAPDVATVWEPKLTSDRYDGTLRPMGDKPGALCGMAMTEKQGGSDVRANQSTAQPVDGGRDGYILTGHKWFCSAPMSDAFLMLAQAPGGLSCFLVPRFTPDGDVNPLRFQRLKDKLGDRSNASAELEFAGVHGQLVGEEGLGVRTIIEMVNHTRLDCVLGSTAIMRQGTVQAIHHARHRQTFGRVLVDHPLMANVLADLALEAEAATVAALRLARCHDPGLVDEHDLALRRIATPVLKYWTCKRAPQHAAEALECLGGNGFVEESFMPRLFRQSPVNGIWEGSGNVICLDVLRAMARSADSVDAFLVELDQAAGANHHLDNAIRELRSELDAPAAVEHNARRIVELMATALCASLLVRHSPEPVADAYCASRLGTRSGVFGTLPSDAELSTIIERSLIPA